ncbi:hypothetical protein N0V88_002227 [Collariella sp. IMI 366227]|nr:hypothetical protein N0V88_002227 [Collariella sp. IMI 366227]
MDFADMDMDMDMDFDAGIEDTKRHPPTQIVRSISPSSLGGFGRPPPTPRPPTPPKSPGTPDLEFDLYGATPEEEEYDYYMDKNNSAVAWPSLAGGTGRAREKFSKKQEFGGYGDGESLAVPLPRQYMARPSSPRGRAVSRAVTGGVGVAAAAARARPKPARLSPHAWREPSPDVWDIEEEREGRRWWGPRGRVKAVDIPAAKPKKKKRVRFVLP